MDRRSLINHYVSFSDLNGDFSYNPMNRFEMIGEAESWTYTVAIRRIYIDSPPLPTTWSIKSRLIDVTEGVGVTTPLGTSFLMKPYTPAQLATDVAEKSWLTHPDLPANDAKAYDANGWSTLADNTLAFPTAGDFTDAPIIARRTVITRQTRHRMQFSTTASGGIDPMVALVVNITPNK